MSWHSITQTHVEDSEGERAEIIDVSDDEQSIGVRLLNGTTVRAPLRLLIAKNASLLSLPISFSKLAYTIVSPNTQSEDIKIPVVEERLVVSKRKVDTGRVRIKKSVNQRLETVSQILTKDEVIIERVAVDEVRDEPAQVTYQGETMIIPVQEEILIIQKKFKVREELHIKRQKTQYTETQTVSLRSEEVAVDREKLN